ITTPTWLGRMPRFAGSTQHGKLKADEWRSFCTITLVYSLIKQWHDKDTRFQQMLANFMALISLVNIAHRRTLDHKAIADYRRATLDYLRGVKTLFLEQQLLPNHHAALHLSSMMQMFGPVISWRTFAFERYNGMIQAINHNSRIGELAVTFMRYFCMGSNIRAILAHGSKLPGAFNTVQDTFKDVFGSDVRGTFLNDSSVFDEEEGAVPYPPRSRRKRGELSTIARNLFSSLME
ncbi:hypothetical protein SISSUDRAFT_995015, partial [Sistotremastrum suecicum HHB10207 ss-3]